MPIGRPAAVGSWAVLLILAVAAVAVAFFAGLGSLPLFDVDEGAFSAATREMFARHDFITPYLYGQPRFDKPILIYWLQGLSAALFGWNELAMRLPSALAAAGWAVAIFLFLARLGRAREGLLAVCIMATSLLVPVIGKAAIADALLNLFLSAAMFSIYLYYQGRRRAWVYWSFVFMGLGFLTKGPIAVAIPLVVSGLFFLLRGQWRAWLRAAFDPVGLGLFAIIALPWYAMETAAQGWAFIDGFFGRHNIGRFTGPMEGHSGGYLYYLPVALLALVPYTAVFIKMLGRLRRWGGGGLELYLLLWFGFVLVFFSFSSTKLPHYLLYGLTGVFILLALHFEALQRRWLAFLPVLLVFLSLALLPPAVHLALPHVRDRFVAAMLAGEQFTAEYYAYFWGAVLVAVYFMRAPPGGQAVKLIVCGLILSLGVALLVLPAVAQVQQQPVKAAAAVARRWSAPLIMWGLDRPSFAFYTGRTVLRRRPVPGDVVLTKNTHLVDFHDYQLLYAADGIALLRLEPPQ